MNNRYRIKIESPVLRPGLTIETECSEKYVAPVVGRLLAIAREINSSAAASNKDQKE